MLSLRSRIFISIAAVVVVGLIIGAIFFVRSRNKNTPTNTNPAATSTSTTPVDVSLITGQQPTTIPAGLPVRERSTEEAEQNGAKQLARIFVERYGTYSTDNASQNVEEVRSLVTPELWQKIAPKTTGKATVFTGVTTQVATMDVQKWTTTNAEFFFKTVRNQLKDGVSSSAQQNITVSMVKVGDAWLVSNFVWQN